MLNERKIKSSYFRDPSLWFLFFANLATIFIAVKDGWSIANVMWLYWFQSIIIGFFNFVRILQLKDFSTDDLRINGKSVKLNKGTKFFLAFFFLVHYGTFHLVYFMFFISTLFTYVFLFDNAFPAGLRNKIDFSYILPLALLFFINHAFSYFVNKPRDSKKQNIIVLMFYPYARIIPMHLTIVFGGFLRGSLVFFLLLKMVADMIMHSSERKIREV